MEFNEKLQQLRKDKGLTQEELAEMLFVSRTAVSKWESGRGYPNIDSLKAIAAFYSVSIDELLSGEEVLTIAEETQRQRDGQFQDLVFGLLDLAAAMFFFLPLFGQKAGESLQEVSLLALTEIPPYVRIAYFFIVISIVLSGIATLALQNSQISFWIRHKRSLSLTLNALGVLLFIISTQPYAASLLFIFLAIKVLIPTKRQ